MCKFALDSRMLALISSTCLFVVASIAREYYSWFGNFHGGRHYPLLQRKLHGIRWLVSLLATMASAIHWMFLYIYLNLRIPVWHVVYVCTLFLQYIKHNSLTFMLFQLQFKPNYVLRITNIKFILEIWYRLSFYSVYSSP